MNSKNLVLPTHIKNSYEFLKTIRKQIDLIVHVSDSRSVVVSQSLNVEKMFGNKKILTIYSKLDLSDNYKLENCFNFKLQESKRKILKLIENTLINKENKNFKQCYQIIVVGIPNVGKSTLINLLKEKRSSKQENSPGTTKHILKFYLGNNIWLYDCPGILLPNTTNSSNIKKLFFLNSLPINDENNFLFLEEAYDYLTKYYSTKLYKFTDLTSLTYKEFLLQVAQKFNLKQKNNIWAIEEAEKKFLLYLHSGKIGRISWDKF